MHEANTLLIVGTMDGGVHALSGASGDLLWSFDSGQVLVSSSSLDKLQEMEEHQVRHRPKEPAHSPPHAADGRGAAPDHGAEARGRVERSDASLPDMGSEWSVSDVDDSDEAAAARFPRAPRGGAEETTALSRYPPSSSSPTPQLAAQPARTVAAVVGVSGAQEEVAAGGSGGESERRLERRSRLGAAGEVLPGEEFEPIIFPALDGSIYMLGEDEQPHRLGEHTVQDLVAMPTIFGEGVLLGRKTTKLYALDALTGQPHYYTDTSSPGGEPSFPAASSAGQLLVSRSDYSVRVIEPSNGKQRWNVSLGEYSLEFLPAERVAAEEASKPAERLSLHVLDGHALCASPAFDRYDTRLPSDRCSWSRSFSSPPVLLYHVDRTSGEKMQLEFVPRLPASGDLRDVSVPVVDLLPVAPLHNLAVAAPLHADGRVEMGQLAAMGSELAQLPSHSHSPPVLRGMHPLLPMLPMLGRLLPTQRRLLGGEGSHLLPSTWLALPTPTDPRWLRQAFTGSASPSPPGAGGDIAAWANSDWEAADDLLSAFSVQQLLLAVRHRITGWFLEHRLLAACLAALLCFFAYWAAKRVSARREMARQREEAAVSSLRRGMPLLTALNMDLIEGDESGVGHEIQQYRERSSSSSVPTSPLATPVVAAAPPPPSRYREEFKQDIRLGKGGFGQVYRARHALDGVEYAVKKVLLTGSERAQERAVREATCLAKLDHPNVVRYYQVWKEKCASAEDVEEFAPSSDEELEDYSLTDEDYSETSRSRRHGRTLMDDSRSAVEEQQKAVLYIQMQLCELTMRQWLQSEGRDPSLEANRPYLTQVLRGLNHIHQASLIHRDLTPANVFITHDKGGEKTFKIGDFGLSREMASDMLGNMPSILSSLNTADSLSPPNALDSFMKLSHKGVRSQSRQITRGVGTTLYMSPEQRKSLPYDHKVDVYSLGIIVLEMCYPVSTQMERIQVLSQLQARQLPEEIRGTPVGDLVLWLTSELPSERPSVAEILASPLMAPHANIRVRAARSRMHALMPAIHAIIERVQRVRSFSAQDTDTVDVTLEYCVGPADDDTSMEASRAALENLRAQVSELDGVKEVNGSGFLLRSSPLPSPGVQPAPSPATIPAQDRLVLPPTSAPLYQTWPPPSPDSRSMSVTSAVTSQVQKASVDGSTILRPTPIAHEDARGHAASR